MPQALSKCILTDDHNRNGQGETSSERGMRIWPFPQSLSGQVPTFLGWRTGARHTQLRKASENCTGQEGRKLQWWATVVPVCTISQTSQNVDAALARADHRATETCFPCPGYLKQRAQESVTHKENFNKNAWQASHLSHSSLSIWFLSEYIQLHRTVRRKLYLCHTKLHAEIYFFTAREMRSILKERG